MRKVKSVFRGLIEEDSRGRRNSHFNVAQHSSKQLGHPSHDSFSFILRLIWTHSSLLMVLPRTMRQSCPLGHFHSPEDRSAESISVRPALEAGRDRQNKSKYNGSQKKCCSLEVEPKPIPVFKFPKLETFSSLGRPTWFVPSPDSHGQPVCNSLV
jgi:hypothetical protein